MENLGRVRTLVIGQSFVLRGDRWLSLLATWSLGRGPLEMKLDLDPL